MELSSTDHLCPQECTVAEEQRMQATRKVSVLEDKLYDAASQVEHFRAVLAVAKV